MTDKPIPTEEEIERARELLLRVIPDLDPVWLDTTTDGVAALAAVATVRAEAVAGRDADWCITLWPTNPEGANNVLNPAAGAEWYRMQIAAARTDGEQAGRDAERAEVVSWCLAADGPSRYDGACGTCADGIERGAHHAKG